MTREESETFEENVQHRYRDQNQKKQIGKTQNRQRSKWVRVNAELRSKLFKNYNISLKTCKKKKKK